MSLSTPAAARRGPSLSAHRYHRLPRVQVLGVGSSVPETVVTNEDLAALGFDSDWILQRTGIRERRHAAAGLATSDLACEAAERALKQAGLEGRELDLILLATCTPDSHMPATACHVQRRLGARAPAMDLNAACSGFMFGLTTGMQYIASGHSQHVLVIGADTMSRLVNPKDRKTYPLFGDGAGAVVLGPGTSDQGMLAYTLGADGEGAPLLHIPGGGSREPISAAVLSGERQFIQMEGRPVFKWAVRMLAELIDATLQEAGVGRDDVKLAVLHQANIRIIQAALEEVGMPRERFLVNVDRYGNTSAASIPLALDEACHLGRVAAGDLVLFCGFGAGLTWGAGLFRW